MLVCVPTKNDTGMDAEIHEHFGSAPFFTLFNTDTKDIKVVENSNAHHTHGTCHPMNQLVKFKIDTVICSGMGRRAVEALNAEGITTLLSNVSNVKEAIAQIADGTAKNIDPLKACHGHGQKEHLHSHELESGRGAGFGMGSGNHKPGSGRGTGGGHGAGGTGRGRG